MDSKTTALPICLAMVLLVSTSACARQTAPERATMKPEPDTQAALAQDKASQAGKDQAAAAAKPVRATIKVEPDIQTKPPTVDESAQPDKQAHPDKRAQAGKKPLKRRAVTQVITPSYRPTLTPVDPAPRPTFGLPAAAMPAAPTGPVQLNCNAGGCTDASGTRYNGGVGTTLIDGNGRTCTRVGTTAQCF
jgi:hypothetical protein